MNASKEEARAAINGLQTILHRSGIKENSPNGEILLGVIEFLKATAKKLPSEEAYEREKSRRKKPGKV